MITDSKFVKSVKSNAPKKGHKIEWQDGKFDNIFNAGWLPLLDEAQKTNRLVTYEKEKNDAGYWNITSLELASETPPPTKPIETEEERKAMAQVRSEVKNPRNDGQTQRSISMSYAAGMASNKVIEPDKLLSYAEVINRWICGDITVKDEAVFKELISKHFANNG